MSDLSDGAEHTSGTIEAMTTVHSRLDEIQRVDTEPIGNTAHCSGEHVVRGTELPPTTTIATDTTNSEICDRDVLHHVELIVLRTTIIVHSCCRLLQPCDRRQVLLHERVRAKVDGRSVDLASQCCRERSHQVRKSGPRLGVTLVAMDVCQQLRRCHARTWNDRCTR